MMVYLLPPSHLSHHQLNSLHLISISPPRHSIITWANPKKLRYHRRQKLPKDPSIPRTPLKFDESTSPSDDIVESSSPDETTSTTCSNSVTGDEESIWEPDEIEAITSLFEMGPPKPKNPRKNRPLPIPKPTTNTNTPKFPTPKHHIRLTSRETLASRLPFTERVQKNPQTLISIAKEIRNLPKNVNVDQILDSWSKFLRKGSLSMIIRELGHMGEPDRAMQVLFWAQNNQPAFFPDDRTLASTIEIMARNGRLRTRKNEDLLHLASKNVMEAMARGFIKGNNLQRAREILSYAKDHDRVLDAGIYVKLMLELGRNPDGYAEVEILLEELAGRGDLDLGPQDCSAVMKICVRLGRFQAAERVFEWYRSSGRKATLVMYTTLIHGRYWSGDYRKGLAAIWEMEEEGLVLDLPAYRVVIKLLVALEDVERVGRYFSRLKEAGFHPTYDIYRDVIRVYAGSGRLGRCRKIRKEVEANGFELDRETLSILSSLEEHGGVADGGN